MKTQTNKKDKDKKNISVTNSISNGKGKGARSPENSPEFRNIEKANDKPAIGIDTKKLETITKILNKTLSNQHVLYLKTRNFHWNLVGRRFHTLHLFLEEQYKALEMAIDETAERIRMVGGIPHGSMGAFVSDATLSEEEGRLVDGDEVIEHLLADHEHCIQALRPAIDEMEEKLDDAGTADFLTDLIKSHEKTAWMLRSHLV